MGKFQKLSKKSQGVVYQAKADQFLLRLDEIGAFWVREGKEVILERAPQATDDEIRLFDDAIKEVTLNVSKGLSYQQRRQQKRLKQRLLRKHLCPILGTALKAFSPGYESVCVLMLAGTVAQLQDPDLIMQIASVQRLTKRLHRFIKEHGSTINSLLYLAVIEGTPKTTNALESTNARFKPFSLIAKSFRLTTAQHFFAGVALMENFVVKTRSRNRSTSAIQRAGIDQVTSALLISSPPLA